MSDGLTAPTTPPTHKPVPPVPARRGQARAVVVQALVALAAFAAAGAAAGWLWFTVWDQPKGVVAQGQWFTDEAGLREDFSGVAWYVALALATGLVLGVLCAWLLDRSELVTLGAVLAGSVLAGYLMYVVGTHLGPADPHDLARTAKDGAKLPGALRVPSWPPRLAFPFGALLGLAVVYGLSVGRAPAEVGSDHAEHTQRTDPPLA